MKKKLCLSFGPVVLAFGLLGILFLLPWQVSFKDKQFIKQAATSLAPEVMKGEMVKNEAVKEDYLPIMGSSELSRFSPFHPAVLAEKYPRNYHPLLLGAAGTQSLTHFFSLSQMDLTDKKAVLVVSPQWFVKNGVKEDLFSFYYSPLQTYDWLLSLKQVDPIALYVASRLLDFSVVKEDGTLFDCLKNLQKKQLPTGFSRQILTLKRNFYKKEDEVFSFFHLEKNNLKRIQRDEKFLPASYDFKTLDKEAFQQGLHNTGDNPYKISRPFYEKRIFPVEKRLKDSQKNFNYCFSKEFSDFQLVLSELARKKVDCLFIIPPVNKRWSDYTGLSQTMLKDFAKKVTYQLKSQGFKEIVDLNAANQEDYFMEDTIHLGWRGWLKAEESIHAFNQEKHATDYQLSETFFNLSWQNFDPEKLGS